MSAAGRRRLRPMSAATTADKEAPRPAVRSRGAARHAQPLSVPSIGTCIVRGWRCLRCRRRPWCRLRQCFRFRRCPVRPIHQLLARRHLVPWRHPHRWRSRLRRSCHRRRRSSEPASATPASRSMSLSNIQGATCCHVGGDPCEVAHFGKVAGPVFGEDRSGLPPLAMMASSISIDRPTGTVPSPLL